MSGNTIFALAGTMHPAPHRSGYFTTSVRPTRIFRGRDEEETRAFLTPPHGSLFHASEVLELGKKYLRENMFRQKFQHEVPPPPRPPGFFKGGKKVESLRGFEWVVWNSYFNCNNVYIWKINFKYIFVILSRKSKAESNLFGWEGYVKGNTSAILRVMMNFFLSNGGVG